jgi:predicted outer membrane repeat protein
LLRTSGRAHPRRVTRRIAFLAIGGFAALALLLAPAVARTIRVDPQGRGVTLDIASAVATAGPGDTILLANGVYRGPGNRDVSITKNVMLRSASGNPDSCVIDCEHQGRGFLIDSRETSPRIDGITVMNGRADTGGAIYCLNHCAPLISNCVFLENRADGDGGALRCAEITRDVHFVNCLFTGNSAGESGGAAAACCCSIVRFEGCTVVDNQSKDGSAISCRGLASVRMSKSIVAFHRGAEPFACGHCYAHFDSCDVFGNEGGDWVGCLDSLATKYGNFSVDPEFESVESNDFRLRQTSPLRTLGFAPCRWR